MGFRNVWQISKMDWMKVLLPLLFGPAKIVSG
jgi:hypothetical protein